MELIYRYGIALSFAVFVGSLMLTISTFTATHTLTEGVNMADRAFLPKYLELKEEDVKGLSNEDLMTLAKAGFGEAIHLLKAYQNRSSEYQSSMKLLAWIMFVQTGCLGVMLFVVYKVKKAGTGK